MKSEYQQIIIFKLRKLRQDNGYSQQQLGAVLGLSNGQIGNIESPHRPHKYTLSQINALCNVFKIRIEQIFLDEDDFNSGNIIDTLIEKIIIYGE
ncbi:MAG: helix-turn-helix transcriptional regulator [Prevotella sp.]|uniref:helix-turn-helix domain-containing protein n=1 Tax=Prevotella sp. TaxID=59823 RepID=UPI002A253A9A|nr:helix-turn-helix transcriptional regulator [Prevotella sp.]MDD7318961.1 helix-turn-helix transcriptional regulator [Prevotellaceae bacterium]MDY4019987.1 helix-turn-helix transcriptional regulator [Prevotella sp.]